MLRWEDVCVYLGLICDGGTGKYVSGDVALDLGLTNLKFCSDSLGTQLCVSLKIEDATDAFQGVVGFDSFNRCISPGQSVLVHSIGECWLIGWLVFLE